MNIFKRDEAMKSLLDLLDIPRLIFHCETYDSIGPNDPNFFNRYEIWQREREKAARAFLENAADEDLWELSETPGSLRSFELEHALFDPPPWYAGGFGVEISKADFAYWAKMDFWSLEEATCLSIGFKPKKMPEKQNLARQVMHWISTMGALSYSREQIFITHNHRIKSNRAHLWNGR